MSSTISRLVVSFFLVGMIGCSASSAGGETKTVVVRQTINELQKEPVPGTVNQVYIEPMYHCGRVPAQLDPRGIYYRPSHKTCSIIRPGKFQKVQFPDANGNYITPRR